MGLQLGARPGEGDAADLEDVRRLRGLQRDVCVLFDDEDGQPFVLVQLSHDPEDLRDEERCKPERRLVEQNAHIALQAAQTAYVLEVGRVALAGPSAELQEHESIRKSYLGY